MIITVSATLQGFNHNLVRAAASLGASPLTAFRRVTLPLIAPGRLKQWLAMLTRNYPEAVVLFNAMRRETDCEKVRHLVNNPPADAA